jgi:spore germination cell wall hydrolase CwlJ-like protein
MTAAVRLDALGQPPILAAPSLASTDGRLRLYAWLDKASLGYGALAIVCLSAILLVAASLAWRPYAGAPSRSAQDPAALSQTKQPFVQVHIAPKVEPLVFADLAPQTARAINEAVPFVSLGPDRAPPFRIASEAPQFARARDCLASAMLYEAGDDPTGQAAVAQVVLNRMRHPAFPHSVCAVVYQGSERATGCQFTFTCDGALGRTPSTGAWQRARAAAAAFLGGETDPAVGMATHYHTDWVHPYWSVTLDKIARVNTHLFFRWQGSWGRRGAFAAAYAGSEPLERKLALLSPAHRDPASGIAENTTPVPPSEDSPAPDRGTISPRDGDHFILIDGGGDGNALAMQGLHECDRQPYCKVVGWDRHSQSYGSPQNPLIRTVAFLYVSDRRTGVEIVLWDCARFNRPSDAQCLSDDNRRWITFQGNLSRAS